MARQKPATCAHCPNALPARRYTIAGQRVCRTCRKHHDTPVRRCPICKRVKPLYDYIEGTRVCATCADRHRRAIPNGTCRQCGKIAYVTRGLCDRHYKRYQIAARNVGICKDCGTRKTLDRRGRCTKCARGYSDRAALRAQLMRLIPGQPASATLEQLYAHLTAHRSLDRVRKWLRTMARPVRTALRAVAKGKTPTWSALQPLRRLRGGEQLVKTCVRAGILQPPKAETDRVDQLLAEMACDGPALAAQTVMQFWRFYQLGRVAVRAEPKLRDRTLESDRQTLKIAFAFVQFVLNRRGTLASMSQRDLTAWSRQAKSSHKPRLRPFLDWLFETSRIKHRLTVRKGAISPARGTGDAIYRAIQRRARTDTTLPVLVRVALLLITMCARYPREIVKVGPTDLRREHGNVVWVQFEHGLAQPLEDVDAQLITELYAQCRRKGGRWLFPSRPRPETHMTAQGLCGRIHAAGIDVNLSQLRNAACRDLLKDFTPMELCEILGMGPRVAEHWQHRGFGLTRAQTAHADKRSREAIAQSARRATV